MPNTKFTPLAGVRAGSNASKLLKKSIIKKAIKKKKAAKKAIKVKTPRAIPTPGPSNTGPAPRAIPITGPSQLKKPKTKKKIKGILRDNLPIFGGKGKVPRG